MKESDFQKEIFQGEIGPLYLITGEEDFLVSGLLKKLKTKVVNSELADFNFHQFDGAGIEIEDVLNIAQTFPALSEKRLVVVKDADLVPARELEKALSYMDHPSPSTCLVWIASKADMRKSFFTRFREKGKIIQCDPLYENQVGPWIRNYLREDAVEIEENAVLFLKTEIGSDLFRLSAELEKLKIFAGNRKKISFADCESLTRGQRRYSVFVWVNEVGLKNHVRALTLLAGFLEEGEQPLVLLAMMIRHLRILLKLKEFLKMGFSRMEVSKGLGIPEKFLPDIYKQEGLFTRKELIAAHSLCLEADFQLKNNVRPPDRVMESLILDLCGGERRFTSNALVK